MEANVSYAEDDEYSVAENPETIELNGTETELGLEFPQKGAAEEGTEE